MIFIVEYVCNKCGKESTRSCSGWQIECECGGQLEEPKPKGKFHYVCAECGHTWSSDKDKSKVCPECKSLTIVIQYDDFNMDLYKEILSNYNDYKHYRYQCSCGQSKYLYSPTMYNVICPIDGELMKHVPADILDRLKQHRKLHRMNQGELAKIFGLSQPTYARIETGQKKIPDNLFPKINKFLLQK